MKNEYTPAPGWLAEDVERAKRAIPFRAEPLRYARAWCCYRLIMVMPMRWAWWRRVSHAIVPYAGDWAYRYAMDGDTAHLQEPRHDR